MLLPYLNTMPQVHSSVYIAEGAKIVGNVRIDEGSSIWFNAVLRGDLAPVQIGKRCNIQDGAIGHVNSDTPLVIDDEVSVGHAAIIHGCRIGKGTLIGMGAIILNGAEIGEYALIGAGSLVTEGTIIPPYTLALGSPAKPIRKLTEDDLLRMRKTWENYVMKSGEFRR